jgi:hypothetical protein
MSSSPNIFTLTPFYVAVLIVQHVFTSVIGSVGNILVLIVYKNKLKQKYDSVTFFIVQLALTDLACCLIAVPINCYHELNIGKMTSDFMCKFHSFLNILNISYSCLLMSLVAVERFLCITYPFKNILTKTITKFTLAILFTFCLFIGLMGALSIGIYHKVYLFHKNATYITDLLDLSQHGLNVSLSEEPLNPSLSTNNQNMIKAFNENRFKRRSDGLMEKSSIMEGKYFYNFLKV